MVGFQLNLLVIYGLYPGHNHHGFLDSMELYSVAKGTWAPGTSLPQPRFACAAALYQGQVCVVGGDSGKSILSSMVLWDEAAGRWVEQPALPQARAACAVVAMGATLFVAGGLSLQSPMPYIDRV